MEELKQIENKCLRKAIGKLLKQNPEVDLSAVILKTRGTTAITAVNLPGRLKNWLGTIQSFLNSGYIVMDFYILNEKGFPVVAQACPWYGCLDCEAPECDEECPPGECN
jgi:hypothetical protein